MVKQKRSQLEKLVERLDREMMARGASCIRDKLFNFSDSEGTPQRDDLISGIQDYYQSIAPQVQDNAFSHINNRDLAKMLMLKARELNADRGIWGEENRKDYYEIDDIPIRKNADSVAAICRKESLIKKENEHEIFTLKVKNYGNVFNLCQSEPFYHQPIAAGRLCTGFLVKDDIIATAGHCIDGDNVKDFRFVFGYKMMAPSNSTSDILLQNIYKGEKIIQKIYRRLGNQSDWALVKLDRKVEGQEVVKLSKNEIAPDRPVYIIGHPVGLPLKYSSGARVCDISDAYFSADLSVYCGSSGSPVFDCETHELIGIVVRGDSRDFRLVENCWKSIIYSRTDDYSKKPQCTRVSEFISDCK
ncbi:MAG: trypsin-like serine peptidase [Candidatus Omnitrophota bacterium]